jgi:hypothetical protein
VTEGVAASKLGVQPIGEATRVAKGIYQLKLPVPFPLRSCCRAERVEEETLAYRAG